MRNYNSLKAILIFAVLIILFSLSIVFINFNDKNSNTVLANKENTLAKFAPREYKTQNNTNTNHLGGSEDEILLNTFTTNDKIYVLFRTLSQDYDLCENKEENEALFIALFDFEGSLLNIIYICNSYGYINSFKINNFIYIFKNEDCGIEVVFDTTKNQIQTTNKHKNLFDTILEIENKIIYIYKNNSEKIININDILKSIPTNYTFEKDISANNKNYLIFYDGQNEHIFDIQKMSFILSFENCKIMDLFVANTDILIAFKLENLIILSKFSQNFEEYFSTQISQNGTDLIKLTTKNSGYLIYTIKENTIIQTFICNHGDIIYENNFTLDNTKEIINIVQENDEFLITTKTINDNFYVGLYNDNFKEKKYMALNTSTIYNYNLFLKDNKIHLLVTTAFSNFEFLDSFGKQEIFIFIK